MQAIDRQNAQTMTPAKGTRTTELDQWMELGLNVPDMPVDSPPMRPKAADGEESSRQSAPTGQMEEGAAAPSPSGQSEFRHSAASFAKWFGVLGVILLLIRHARP